MSDYDLDIYVWSQGQGALLRRLAAGDAANDADLDWPNIAEEIETVGRSERTAVASHIANIIEHLIKLQVSPAIEPRAGWHGTIGRTRVRVERLLDDQPEPASGGICDHRARTAKNRETLPKSRWRSTMRRLASIFKRSLIVKTRCWANGFPTSPMASPGQTHCTGWASRLRHPGTGRRIC